MSDRKIIAADYQAMEVRVFAHFSGDKRLQAVFPKNEDIYSRVAIDVFGRDDLSAHPDEDNFLKRVEPNLRADSKVFTLSVPYGAEGFQVAAELGYTDSNGRVDSTKGTQLIEKYLSTYPNLRRYMVKQELMFKQHGYVQNLFGRIRRFEEAHKIYKRYGDNIIDPFWAKKNYLREERKIVKKALNAAKNFPIQSTAASIVNRSLIELGQWIEKEDLDIRILLTVHDENVIDCSLDLVELASEKLKYYMENNSFAKALEVPLVATPIVGNNLAECK